MLSFVCSVGNVPLAVALWHGGISFGGVVSFVFADLLTVPLLLIYRRYYGARITLRLLGVFWAMMSLSGMITQYLFRAVGLVPSPHTKTVVATGVHLDYTTVLNVIALLAFAFLYWLYRNRDRFGAGGGYAKDVVCGMQVERAHAPATSGRLTTSARTVAASVSPLSRIRSRTEPTAPRPPMRRPLGRRSMPPRPTTSLVATARRVSHDRPVGAAWKRDRSGPRGTCPRKAAHRRRRRGLAHRDRFRQEGAVRSPASTVCAMAFSGGASGQVHLGLEKQLGW